MSIKYWAKRMTYQHLIVSGALTEREVLQFEVAHIEKELEVERESREQLHRESNKQSIGPDDAKNGDREN